MCFVSEINSQSVKNGVFSNRINFKSETVVRDIVLTGVDVEEADPCDSLGATATALYDHNPCIPMVIQFIL